MVTRADLAEAGETAYFIRLADIVVAPDRLRSLKTADADAFAVALREDGQYEPIAVTQLPGRADFLLVDGLHRLEGARRAGWLEIKAGIVGPDAAARVRREVLSEVVRAASDEFDRSAQIKALVDLARDGGIDRPNAPAGDAEAEMISARLGWTSEAAEVLGITPRSVRNHLLIARTFDADWIMRLRRLGHADQLVPLLLLAKQEPRIIGKVIAWLEAAGIDAAPNLTIAEAIAAVTGRTAPTPADKRFNAVIGNLSRMAAPELRATVDRIIAQHVTTLELEAILASRRAQATHGRDETLAERFTRTGSID